MTSPIKRNSAGVTRRKRKDERKTTMYPDDKQILENAQDTKIVYLPNPARLHAPLLGIKRIDNHQTCLFYLEAWGLLPDRYNVQKSKKQNRDALIKLRKKFYATAKKSGVKVGRGAKVTSLLRSVQICGARSVLNYEKTEALITALYYLQSSGGGK